jgi:hypothetical protein
VTSFSPVFRGEFKQLLDDAIRPRAEAFEAMFVYLESVRKASYVIVETGCVRQDDWIDGRATVLFDQFLQTREGCLYSVDIDADRCAYARSQVSDRTTVINEDSVSFLYRFARGQQIDLLYLDSYDVDWNDPHESALHHLKELYAAMPALKAGSLVVVDDHLNFDGRVGKSKYIVPFMHDIGARKLFEAYQIGWIIP